MRAIALLGILANAPVRDDIVELRHGRFPTLVRVLGWTADHRVVLHEALYGFQDGSGAPEGRSSLVVAGADGKVTTIAVLVPETDAGNEARPFRVPTALAERAIHAEAAALAALGNLQPSTPLARSTLVVVHGECSVQLASHRRTIATVMTIGPNACITDGHDLGVRDARIVDVHGSPDGHELAVTVAVTTHSLDSYASELRTVVVATPPD